MSDADDAYDDDALAAEYVLHLLDADERSAFEARLRGDRDLLARVRGWEARLSPLSDEVEAMTPSPGLKSKVMSAVDATSRTSSGARRWWMSLVGAVAVVAALAILVGTVLREPADLSPAFQAELSGQDGALLIVAGVIPATHEIVLERVAGAVSPGRVHELWLIAQGSEAPVSLGLLENEGTTRIRVPDEIAPGVRTGTLAISDEPEGGSPTGAPTGEVLATATFTDL